MKDNIWIHIVCSNFLGFIVGVLFCYHCSDCKFNSLSIGEIVSGFIIVAFIIGVWIYYLCATIHINNKELNNSNKNNDKRNKND